MIGDALAAILDGQVVGLPTDTVYGIGADPFNPDAVALLFELKGRPAHKPVGLLVATVEQAREIGEISGDAAELAARHWPGALTLVVTPKVVMADWVGDQQTRTIGIRVPHHPVALDLLTIGGPLAVTSANVSGGAEAMSDEEARDVFGESVAVYIEGTAPGGEASTVVDATGGELVVLRQGPVAV
ncbi:MAG TPA: L-threonylcarbamoyladenylate synthase [Acidimicrobiia bacterium]|nr:L-threonylcarbamoyladenylate synthase [Acidimicrobiia bacterium]